MSMTLSEDSRSFAYQATMTTSTRSVLATLNRHTFFTLDLMTRHSRCGIGEVWAMAGKPVSFLATPKV
jgi:hypothetical protein